MTNVLEFPSRAADLNRLSEEILLQADFIWSASVNLLLSANRHILSGENQAKPHKTEF